VFEQVYARVDVPDRSVEHWQHVQGCRVWLVLKRNPSTGVIDSVHWLGAAL
jgi:sarcosine oxidase delta subunit